jgi:hypothetical protein
MQSVINVLMNRASARGTSVYAESVRRLQFSSMTAAGDPNLILYPPDTDPQWQTALSVMAQADAGTLEDITEGATSYYALSMTSPPYWAASMTHTFDIEGQRFYRA